jgi:hypothetical protein
VDDQVIIDAYLHTKKRFLGSVDNLLCWPEQRAYFLERCRDTLGDIPEPTLLTRLVNLRKRSKLPTGAPPSSF